jgi:ribonuclease P protein component
MSKPVPDATPPILIGRLKKRASFLRLRKGNAWRTRALVLQARRRSSEQGAQEDAARFGFTATRRLGPAVIRNRARRRLKEAVRLIASAHAKPGYDYAVIARQGALTRSFAQLQRDLCSALDHIHKDQSARPDAKARTRG